MGIVLERGINVVIVDPFDWEGDRRVAPTEEELRERLEAVMAQINEQGGTLVSTQVMKVGENIDRRHPMMVAPPGEEDRLVLFVSK